MRNTICIAGKNQIALNATRYLYDNLHIDKKHIKIITNSNDIGIDSWQPSFKKFAIDNKIEIITLEKAYKIPKLIFISLEFDKIIKPNRFKTKKLYNMHFSLLPAYKGMYTATLPLLNGESKGGVSFHLIDDGIDTGDIIGQMAYDIKLSDTAYSIYLKNLEYSFALFKEVIESVLSGNVNAVRQHHIGASYYSKKAIDFQNIVIDFNKTSFEIYNHLRAFIFPPYQLPKIDDEKIYKCILTDEKIKDRKIVQKDSFIISGIDSFKIIAYKLQNSKNVLTDTMGGGNLYLNLTFLSYCNFTPPQAQMWHKVA